MGCSAINWETEKQLAQKLANQEEAWAHYRRAVEDYERGRYASAEEKMTYALKYLSGKEIETKFKKLKTVARLITIESAETREAELIRKGVLCYIDGYTEVALDVFYYVWYLDQGNERLKQLCKEIGYEEGISMTRLLGLSVDSVTEKLFSANSLYDEGKYPDVIKLCNEIFIVEPNNTTAIKKKGYAYYKLEKKSDAKRALEKAFMLDPDDEAIKKFIEKIDKELPKDKE